MITLWTIDGTPVKSFMDIHQDCMVLVASPTQRFVGLNGLHEFVNIESGRQQLETEFVKPKAHSWIQTAAVSWLKSNQVEDLPNYMEAPQKFVANAPLPVQQQ